MITDLCAGYHSLMQKVIVIDGDINISKVYIANPFNMTSKKN